jgi:hypothetical protein
MKFDLVLVHRHHLVQAVLLEAEVADFVEQVVAAQVVVES